MIHAFRVLLLLALLGAATMAQAQPDPILSLLWTDGGTVVVCPEGDGENLLDVGAVVHLQLVDVNGNPMSGYSENDMVLSEPWNVPPQLFYCDTVMPLRPGIPPDGPTDARGHTTFSTSMFAGGVSDLGLTAKIHGGMLPVVWEIGLPPVDVRVTSPDLNGDGQVTLPDLAEFAVEYTGAHSWRVDYNADGTVNLADFAIFAEHYGHGCP